MKTLFHSLGTWNFVCYLRVRFHTFAGSMRPCGWLYRPSEARSPLRVWKRVVLPRRIICILQSNNFKTNYHAETAWRSALVVEKLIYISCKLLIIAIIWWSVRLTEDWFIGRFKSLPTLFIRSFGRKRNVDKTFTWNGITLPKQLAYQWVLAQSIEAFCTYQL